MRWRRARDHPLQLRPRAPETLFESARAWRFAAWHGSLDPAPSLPGVRACPRFESWRRAARDESGVGKRAGVRHACVCRIRASAGRDRRRKTRAPPSIERLRACARASGGARRDGAAQLRAVPYSSASCLPCEAETCRSPLRSALLPINTLFTVCGALASMLAAQNGKRASAERGARTQGGIGGIGRCECTDGLRALALFSQHPQQQRARPPHRLPSRRPYSSPRAGNSKSARTRDRSSRTTTLSTFTRVWRRSGASRASISI